MKYTSIKKCKKLAKEIFIVPPKLKRKKTWFYFPEKELIWIAKKDPSTEEEQAINLQYFQDLTNTKFSLFTYSFLHELGHYNADLLEEATDEEVEENNNYFETILTGLKLSLINYKEALELYYQEDSELKANEFVIEIINSCFNSIYYFDDNL